MYVYDCFIVKEQWFGLELKTKKEKKTVIDNPEGLDATTAKGMDMLM